MYIKAVKRGIAISMAMLCFAVHAHCQVYVGGNLTNDATYSPANNPYIVTQNLVVAESVTLTILPGVEMLFAPATGLINNGTLIAKGTPEQKIHFLPQDPSVFPGLWNGITFNSSKSAFGADSAYVAGSIMSEVFISNSSNSITLAKTTSLLIENTLIERCVCGVYIKDAGYNVVRNCTFNICDFGIYIAGGFLNPGNKIYGNSLNGCRDAGIFINSISSESNHNTITGNQINSCSIGLNIGNFSNNGPSYNFISENSFVLNKDAIKLFQQSNSINNNYFIQNRSGITCWQSDNNTITQNLFSGNSLNAITLAAGSSYNNISYNSINYNRGGVWIKPDSSRNSLNNSFQYNTAYYNTGFSLQIQCAPQGPVQFNNIAHNGNYQSFRNLCGDFVHAEYNYWGTTSNNLIDTILYDINDNPQYGEVLHQSILNQVLTTAPVPPPAHVIKQQIGNEVVVSWDTLAIADLNAYNVYYGQNDFISFANKVQTGQETLIRFANITIDDTLAVTAFDVQADGAHDQTEGHESDFAYAVLMPYAGPDTALCYNSEYVILDATAFNYSSLTWTTSGDGVFNLTHVLHPVYIPGALDYLNGHVFLYLNAEGSETRFSDASLITFQKAPAVFSGNDTTITANSALWLEKAWASGYDHKKWTSSGDGTFNSDTTSNAVYTPGINDISTGSATLTLTAFSACGSASDQIRIGISPGYSIEGSIHAGNVLATNSSIRLYKEVGGDIQPIRTPTPAPDGNFSVTSLFAGTYYLYASPDKATNPEFFPTYYFNDIRWQNAYRLQLYANTSDVDIQLNRSTVNLPIGEGSIFGYCTATPGSTGKCGDVTILLYDRKMKNVIDWLPVSDGSDFRFKNLPYGTYILSGEKTGSEPFDSEIIELSPSQPKIENVELVCTNAGGYKFSLPGNTNQPAVADILLYPNPVTDFLYFNGLPAPGNYEIQLSNTQGQVRKFSLNASGTNAATLIPGAVPSGIYIIEVSKNGYCLLRQKLLKL